MNIRVSETGLYFPPNGRLLFVLTLWDPVIDDIWKREPLLLPELLFLYKCIAEYLIAGQLQIPGGDDKDGYI
ncbi:hypothetical protein D3C85_1304830 [compost metagenome]